MPHKSLPAKTLLFCVLFVMVSGGFAQEAGRPLASEINSIENIINAPPAGSANPENRRPGAAAATEPTPASRQEALMRLARLQQLSGDMEAGAKTWLAAAAVQPGSPPADTALVSAGYCLAAMGEWEKASTAIAPLLRENGPASVRARYLEACARAWTVADASGLCSLAQNPQFRELRSAIYYTLWKFAGVYPETPDAGTADEWKSRLLTEFPHSPEARIAASEPLIGAKPSLHWLALPAPGGWQLSTTTGGAVQGAPQTPVPPPATVLPPVSSAPAQSSVSPVPSQPPASPAPAQSPAPPPVTVLHPASPAPAQPAPASRVLQTGLFGVESNAKNQIEQLHKAGFPAAIIRRTVNGKEMWAVTVPTGSNINKTIEDLKKAGFDSFPL
jgi:cell division septation protein DedD